MPEMVITVLDGMGGGIGARVVEILKEELPAEVMVYGLGTNSLATADMLKKGANRGATGENAIVYNVARADVVVGAISMMIPNGMIGEVTTPMVEAIAASSAIKILIPILPEGTAIVALEKKPLLLQIREAADLIKTKLESGGCLK
ncbi:DUF3842 family protein [Eubacterium aggregans]|uniref:DUF3842 family protein n=1 Tax=Eubacterium aggregans TaxID=81409 RepID=UPI003F3F49ED